MASERTIFEMIGQGNAAVGHLNVKPQSGQRMKLANPLRLRKRRLCFFLRCFSEGPSSSFPRRVRVLPGVQHVHVGESFSLNPIGRWRRWNLPFSALS